MQGVRKGRKDSDSEGGRRDIDPSIKLPHHLNKIQDFMSTGVPNRKRLPKLPEGITAHRTRYVEKKEQDIREEMLGKRGKPIASYQNPVSITPEFERSMILKQWT